VVTSLTSAPRPIEPWFVGHSVVDDGARIGFVYAPGRTYPGSASPEWRRDLETDLRALRHHHSVDVLVSLMAPEEMAAMGIAALPERAGANGMEWIGFPIPDMGVPQAEGEYRALLRSLCERLRAGHVVVLHCLGGLGRSGTVTACVLVELGMSPEEAIAEVRRSRPGAIQTVAQERLVRSLAPVRCAE
jgi:ADP-ribosyl-[dinitrogen reductase] hydrolase